MQLVNSIPINFQKRLIAKCQIGEKQKAQEANIYLLDKLEDKKILLDASDKEIWKNDYYLHTINDDFKRCIDSTQHYIMENQDGDVICISKTSDRPSKVVLNYIETAPKLSCYNNMRTLKYIGETMLAFLVKKAKNDNKYLDVPAIAERTKTRNFYFKQCGFKEDRKHSATLSLDKADKFIKKNEKHTGKCIEIMK